MDEPPVVYGSVIPAPASADSVFLAWEKLRLVYNAALVAVVFFLAQEKLHERPFWRLLVVGAVIANLAFCLGPVGEGYLALLGANRRVVRWILFLVGTVFACLLAGHHLRGGSLRDLWRPTHAPGTSAMQRASSGQIHTHKAHDTQSRGRGNHGSGPAMAIQVVGHTVTQSPQPVQRDGSTRGSSVMAALQTAHRDER